MKRKVYIIEPNASVVNMFKNKGWEIATDYDKTVHLACFTGGEDISSFLYGEKTLKGKGWVNFARDMKEVYSYKQLPRHVPKVGICRGAQLMNVLCGGSMWQDVDNHCVYHDMYDCLTGEVVGVSSLHHQMMRPAPDAQILAIANESNYKESQYDKWLRADPQEEAMDVEECMYDHDNAFCAQYHPEFGPKSCHDHFFKRLDTIFGQDFKRIDKATIPQEVVCG